jgi:hypothetical protein
MGIKYLLRTASDCPKNIFEVFSKKYASNQGRNGMNILFWYEKNFLDQLFELNTNRSFCCCWDTVWYLTKSGETVVWKLLRTFDECFLWFFLKSSEANAKWSFVKILTVLCHKLKESTAHFFPPKERTFSFCPERAHADTTFSFPWQVGARREK